MIYLMYGNVLHSIRFLTFMSCIGFESKHTVNLFAKKFGLSLELGNA